MGRLVCLCVTCLLVTSVSASADVGGTSKRESRTDGGTLGRTPTGGTEYGAPLKEESRRSRAERRQHKLRRKKTRHQHKREPDPAPSDPTPVSGESALTFPIKGDYTLGGDDARFGTKRKGHSHQGQDIPAAEGTPIVSPSDGVVRWRAYQAGAAGYYVVVDDKARNRSYAFMHLRKGSWLVNRGDTVHAGQQIGEVGHTGDAEGPHLHFEIWENGWYEKDGAPIDPLPYLLAWKS